MQTSAEHAFELYVHDCVPWQTPDGRSAGLPVGQSLGVLLQAARSNPATPRNVTLERMRLTAASVGKVRARCEHGRWPSVVGTIAFVRCRNTCRNTSGGTIPMAGITVGASRSARRALDSELNMVPMIDLLMVTISFLLITAVWSHMARLQADAMVPGGTDPAPAKAEARLHVEMGDPGKITLHWNVGRTVVRSTEIPRREVVTVERGARAATFPDLRAKLEEEWHAMGSHSSATDPASDELVLHTSDSASYAEIVGAMDAAFGVKRACAGGRACPAFRVVFASD